MGGAVIDAPLRAFAVGIVASELMQWGFWLRKNPGGPRLGYFSAQAATLIGNMGVNGAVCYLWAQGGLDVALEWIAQVVPFLGASDWATSGIPYTPQMGLWLGCMSDFFGDDLAYNLVEVMRIRLERLLGKPSATPPPAAP
jgi:hypothetical protein